MVKVVITIEYKIVLMIIDSSICYLYPQNQLILIFLSSQRSQHYAHYLIMFAHSFLYEFLVKEFSPSGEPIAPI